MEGGAPPPIETVCAAIETLYHNPDPREKERASNWLQDLQKSVFAWKVSTSIITQVDVIYYIAYICILYITWQTCSAIHAILFLVLVGCR